MFCIVVQVRLIGGIGLSQFTKSIAEQLGDENHKYIDGNVLYDDNELRKLIELIAEAMCWTIQDYTSSSYSS